MNSNNIFFDFHNHDMLKRAFNFGLIYNLYVMMIYVMFKINNTKL